MKKNFLSIAILVVVIILSSCGSSSSSFENDVRKMAEYQCKVTKLSVNAATDEKAKKELEELSKEMTKYAKEMEKKYESKKDDKEMEAKANVIMKEVMDKCK
jgi:thiamine biosynthesis lipoprotein ApbE